MRPNAVKREDVPEVLHGELEDAILRAEAAGAEPATLEYVGAGMEGIVLADGDVAYKVGRGQRRGRYLRDEAAALEALDAAGAPVPAFYDYDAEHDVIVREHIVGRPGGWGTRGLWDFWKARIEPVLLEAEFTRGEYKEDSFIVQPDGGIVMVDLGMVGPTGQRAVREIRARLAELTPGSDYLWFQSEILFGLSDGHITPEQASAWAGELEAVFGEETMRHLRQEIEFEERRRGKRRANPPDIDEEWVAWVLGDGAATLAEVHAAGFKHEYLGTDIRHDLPIGPYVVISDEYPGGDVLVAKKRIPLRVELDEDLEPIRLSTQRAIAKERILAAFRDGHPIVLRDRHRDEFVALIHPSTRPGVTWQGTRFDAEGPMGHVEGKSQEEVLDRMIEDDYWVPDRNAMDDVLRQNPPYSGWQEGWWEKPLPKNRNRIRYPTKRDALNVFLDWNRAIVDDYGGESQKHSPASFDAINEKFGIRGNRRVDTIAKAVWWALPPGGPYYLEDIDTNLLNQTAPAIFNRLGLSFTLPDAVEEARLLEQEKSYWEERYGGVEYPEEEAVPF